LISGNLHRLPSSTGKRKIHYIEFAFDIAEYVQQAEAGLSSAKRYSIVQPPVKPALQTGD
jgi:hypothetical protein